MKLAWNIFVVFVVFDTTQGVAQSAIRASQQQKCGAIITAVAYWVIGIPVALLLVFYYPLGIRGLWIAPTLAVVFLTITYITIFTGIDWQDLIIKARGQRKLDKQSATAKTADKDDHFQRSDS